MSTPTRPFDEPLDLPRVVRLEEDRLARGVASVADEAAPVSGGMMCYSGPGSWSNRATGLGIKGPVDPADVDRVIEFYESRGVEPRLDACSFAHPTLIEALADRGFVTREFEHVFVRRTTDVPPAAWPEDTLVTRVDPSDEAAAEDFVHVRATAFEETRDAVFERIERRILRSPGCVCLLVRIEGRPAAAGVCEIDPPVAALFGAATLEPHRRRGLQRALMLERIRAAADAGCEFVTVGSSPAVATGRNALRLGFQLACARATMVRPTRA